MHFEILSNPEFLAEGTAIADLEAPDRVCMQTSSLLTCTCLHPHMCWLGVRAARICKHRTKYETGLVDI